MATVTLGNLNEELRSPVLRRLYDYWRGKWHTDNLLPGRADIDPLDFSYALGDITLVDVMYEPLRFRFRLDGTRHVEHFGFDMTGRMLDDFPEPVMRESLYENYRDIVDNRSPRRRYRGFSADGRPFHYETLLLPLAGDGRRIDMIIVAIAFHDT